MHGICINLQILSRTLCLQSYLDEPHLIGLVDFKPIVKHPRVFGVERLFDFDPREPTRTLQIFHAYYGIPKVICRFIDFIRQCERILISNFVNAPFRHRLAKISYILFQTVDNTPDTSFQQLGFLFKLLNEDWLFRTRHRSENSKA